MDRWQRRPPVSGMPIEEMKRRVADGIKRRRQTGELPPENLRKLVMRADGPTLNKQQRRVMIHAAELAIYSLANHDRIDYCGAADVILAVCREAGFGKPLYVAMLSGVAEQAAELAGEDFKVLDQIARHWLAEYYTPSGKIISIAKGDTNGNGQSTSKLEAHPEPKAPPGKGH